MKGKDIQEGGTYHFVGSDNPERQHLAGQAFTVTTIRPVFRRFKIKGTRKVNRYFNADGVGARAEELEPLPEREAPCSECAIGEMIQDGLTQPSGSTDYQCNNENCGHRATFP